MADVSSERPSPSDPTVSARMSRQAIRDTAPELRLRRTLFSRGHRYRVGRPVPGMRRCSIDIAFVGLQVAVFVDGCFWHRCPEHGTVPRSNGAWWARKLDANVQRDRRVDAALVDAGWTVVRIWEHEPTDDAAARVEQALRHDGFAPKVARR